MFCSCIGLFAAKSKHDVMSLNRGTALSRDQEYRVSDVQILKSSLSRSVRQRLNIGRALIDTTSGRISPCRSILVSEPL